MPITKLQAQIAAHKFAAAWIDQSVASAPDGMDDDEHISDMITTELAALAQQHRDLAAALERKAASPTEGWGVIRPGDRRAHYYRNQDALCGKVGFYTGTLDAEDKPSPDDCAACRRKRDKEKASA